MEWILLVSIPSYVSVYIANLNQVSDSKNFSLLHMSLVSNLPELQFESVLGYCRPQVSRK